MPSQVGVFGGVGETLGALAPVEPRVQPTGASAERLIGLLDRVVPAFSRHFPQFLHADFRLVGSVAWGCPKA